MNKSYIYVVRYNSIIKCTMDTVVVAASIEDAPRVAGIENSSSLVSVERVGVSDIYVVRYNSIIKCTMDIVVVAASIEDAPRVAGIENSSSLVSVERVGVSDDPAERVLAQEEP